MANVKVDIGDKITLTLNQPERCGVEISKDGIIREGWLDKGACRVRDFLGRSRISEYREGTLTGWGIIEEYSEGKVYFGQIEAGKKVGMGMGEDKAGKSRYVGMFERGEMKGLGRVYDPIKDRCLQGYFDNGKLDGIGSESTKEGSYRGYFQGGIRQGAGVFRSSAVNSKIIMAEWSAESPDGFALEVSPADNTVSQLYYKQGKRQGKGRVTSSKDGTIYVGSLDNEGNYSGLGELLSTTTSDYYIGEWQSGLKHGLGYDKTQQGAYYGYFSKGTRHGKGYFTSSVVEQLGEFVNGHLHGLVVYSNGKNKNMVGTFSAGSLVKKHPGTDHVAVRKAFFLPDFENFVVESRLTISGIREDMDKRSKDQMAKMEEIDKKCDDIEAEIEQIQRKIRQEESRVRGFISEIDRVRQLLRSSSIHLPKPTLDQITAALTTWSAHWHSNSINPQMQSLLSSVFTPYLDGSLPFVNTYSVVMQNRLYSCELDDVDTCGERMLRHVREDAEAKKIADVDRKHERSIVEWCDRKSGKIESKVMNKENIEKRRSIDKRGVSSKDEIKFEYKFMLYPTTTTNKTSNQNKEQEETHSPAEEMISEMSVPQMLKIRPLKPTRPQNPYTFSDSPYNTPLPDPN